MRDSIENAAMNLPNTQCPRCGRWEIDFDGFGILAHTTPAYPHGCGYCSHPSWTDGVCGICGMLDIPPFATVGRMIVVTSNLGFPLIVKVCPEHETGDLGWYCVHGAFKGRWVTPRKDNVRQLLMDGDVIEDEGLVVKDGMLTKSNV